MKRDKLTLRLEEKTTEKAKRFAKDHNTSVFRMVAAFFDALEGPNSEAKQHGPITTRLRGALKAEQSDLRYDEEDYLRYLEK